MQLTTKTIAVTTVSLLLLGACSSTNQTATAPSSPAVSPSATAPSPTTSAEQTAAAKPEAHGGQGGQVIESGPYHLELLTLNEADGIHIDFFLQKGDNHTPVPNAKVTAQVQLPDGSQKAIDMKYDADGKHYYAELSGTLKGEYKVAVLSDIKGEKVNARYTFKR
ncbi:MAG TPA: hypothetical protein IGS53_15990 [Leptolyngbyaceae cyanobacterium M33_DOE_097]|uniref:YtkA-like domain-containing protein n=1 Tax=Oscillatoriales cyanobacterium SpSt-418 TaxID=2282169 RepID=A0A7C3KJF1_9CYAN|nr:hypothetical protein [Leptolyngbyaceae cyanobacterium M33_DOE_097]